MTNRDVVRRFIESALADDKATTAALMHPGFFIREAESLPYAGTYRGLDGLARLLANISACFDQHRVEIRAIMGEAGGSEFGVLLEMSGTKCGRAISVSVFEHYVVRNGKVAEIWPYYWDTKVLADFFAR